MNSCVLLAFIPPVRYSFVLSDTVLFDEMFSFDALPRLLDFLFNSCTMASVSRSFQSQEGG